MSKKTYILLFLLSVVCFKTFGQRFTEYEIKAAYIFNFTKFVTWPEKSFDNNVTPYVLGIYGKDVFGDIIKDVIGKRKSNGRKWIVKYYSSPEQIQQCNILFISDIQPSELQKLLKQLKHKPILTVGDNIPGFCQKGGVVNFTAKGAAKRFEINNNAAKAKNLHISAKLLMLSKILEYDEIKF